jgi:hypothetical protein
VIKFSEDGGLQLSYRWQFMILLEVIGVVLVVMAMIMAVIIVKRVIENKMTFISIHGDRFHCAFQLYNVIWLWLRSCFFFF